MAAGENGESSSNSLTIVIKVGTSSLVRPETQSVNLGSFARVCETVRRLRDQGHRVCLVSSGAVGMGCQVLRLSERPEAVSKRQALAAIGQGALMRVYTDFFNALSLTCAQVLVTAESLASDSQYSLARDTFRELLEYGAVPIVNENDTINVQELRFGDNDTLSAQVAAMIEADWLVLLTDVDYLYTANPSVDPTATPIKEVTDVARLEVDTSTAGTAWGTGGMATKLTAGRIATAAGCSMAICNAARPEAVETVVAGGDAGTVFRPLRERVRGRKRWILSVPTRGQIHVDQGCADAVLNKKNVYAAGITAAQGSFGAMDAVVILSGGAEIARGLINYSAEDVKQIAGLPTGDFPEHLRCSDGGEVLYRCNVACVADREALPASP